MREIARIDPHHAVLEQTATSELARLTPPPSLAHDWRLILAYRRRLANELATLARAAARKDATAIQALAASKKQLHLQLRRLATRDGFKECAEAHAISSSTSPSAAHPLHSS
jgi:hypothetical protein